MEIKLLEHTDREKFSELAKTHGTVFNRIEWLNIYGESIKLFGIYDNEGKIFGGFHLYYGKQFGLTHVNNPPYTPTIGLFFENKTKNKANSSSFEKGIINLLREFVENTPYKILTLALPPNFKDLQPFIWNDFKVVPNYTYRYNLELNTTEQLSALMSPERRNDIKKAVKDGIVTRQSSDYKQVKELVLKTFDRKEKAVNEELLNKILFEFANTQNSFAFISYRNEMPIACSFCIHDNKTAYYLLGGYDSRNKHQGAGASAVWMAAQHAKTTGLSCFDFEGSMIPEVEKYFRAFGGDLTPYYTINKAMLPLEFGLKFIKRNQF